MMIKKIKLNEQDISKLVGLVKNIESELDEQDLDHIDQELSDSWQEIARNLHSQKLPIQAKASVEG
ncbi:hypothetical protein [Pseudobacteriovorax antillogorgiicola]|uniref:Uncharacterized protein n=1 Tax=Pseudobacteriovorax antillogorgiicola TaxID=1513793 RepID=A0A1Y6C2I0_9BACT|nr:hypothetical protein [Pseudobacteriovorax antillogorgiicola]TCS49758.1 hypothetical protein EDD56_1143 [Pseudobacteriovorax antillogorgiicola]SMF42480.1 hypothetical protein SAMN06296036_1132 [Pseudobacteriovorax antillogorgiicola]